MIQTDKILHFLVSFILILLFTLIFNLKLTIIIVFIIGIIKELYDYFVKKRNDCLEDLLANCCGIIMATIILWIIK